MSLFCRIVGRITESDGSNQFGRWDEKLHPRDKAGRFGSGGSVEVHPDLAPIAERVKRVVDELNANYGDHVKFIKPSSLDPETGPMGHKSIDTIYLNAKKATDPAYMTHHAKEWNGLRVDASLEGIVTHEYGHVVFGHARSYNIDRFNAEVSPISSDLGDGSLTTPYGMEDSAEKEAESFATVQAGRTVVPKDHPFYEKLMAEAHRHVKAALAILSGPPTPKKTPKKRRSVAQ